MNHTRLPPDQQLVAAGKWPLVGEHRARAGNAPWTVTLTGLVQREQTWTLAELAAMPRTEQVVDLHCVTRWSKLAVPFAGVRLSELLDRCGIEGPARFASFVARSDRQHSTSLPLAELHSLDPLVAFECDGVPLPAEHGGPVRLVVPDRYFYKSLKWLERIELLTDDRLGFWERTAGYHNGARPWNNERYLAPTLSRQQMARALASRDFSDQDLRSLDARGHDLAGLVARRAILRDADFRQANLSGADFSAANLSNAHFAGANLRGASLAGADVEGADFGSADLRGADFRGAALIGATFCRADEGASDASPPPASQTALDEAAIIDHTTRFDAAAIELLTPGQQRLFDRR